MKKLFSTLSLILLAGLFTTVPSAFATWSPTSYSVSDVAWDGTNFSFTTSTDITNQTDTDNDYLLDPVTWSIYSPDGSTLYEGGSLSCSGTSCTGTLGGQNIDPTGQTVIVKIVGSYDISLGNSTNTFTFPAVPTPTPTPTPDLSVSIITDPATSDVTVGAPFNVDVKINSDSDHAFNAAQATVSVSSNLSVTGIHNATSNACNLQYTKHPTTSDPSFAGAVYGGSSTGCTVYTMTVTPTSDGTGTISFTNTSIKSYSDNSEIITGTQDGSFTIADGPTPTPTTGLDQLTVTSPLQTYYLDDTYTLTGTKDSSTTTVYINGSSTGVTYPTDTTWQVSETLAALGDGNTPSDNNFTIYGTDDDGNSTASQTVDVSRHTLGDISGDGNIDLTDASLFAADWGKTDPSTFTYALSDMNGDGVVDLTDLSILAKLEE